MPEIKGKPSFNHKVVKALTKEQFLEQHPEHGSVWDELNKVAEPKAEKPKKGK